MNQSKFGFYFYRPLIPLMWAHYSEKHTGICFGIKIPVDFKNEKEIVVTKSVKYNSIIQQQSILTEDNEKIMLAIYNWLYSKSCVWDYEEEMRTCRIRLVEVIYNVDFIVPKGNEFEDLLFDKNSLVEIHYGLNTSQNEIDKIEELIRVNGYNNSLKRYKIEKVKGTYNLESKQIR